MATFGKTRDNNSGQLIYAAIGTTRDKLFGAVFRTSRRSDCAAIRQTRDSDSCAVFGRSGGTRGSDSGQLVFIATYGKPRDSDSGLVFGKSSGGDSGQLFSATFGKTRDNDSGQLVYAVFEKTRSQQL